MQEVTEMDCEYEKNVYRDCVDTRKGAKPSTTKRGWQIGLLRLLGINRSYEDPLSMSRKLAQDYSPVELEKALLEAEVAKAKALMEWQKHSVIY
jgi:hypothetical protein